MPLLTHTGDEASFTRACNEFADPRRLALPLEQGVTVIAAHMAASGTNQGRGNMARLITLMQRYPNLYGDISALTQVNHYGALGRALEDKQLHNRLLYGTDYPLINTLLCMPLLHVFAAGFTEAIRIQAIDNPWDRDVELKRALGVPEPVFTRFTEILRSKQDASHRP
jgi:predicted TIM-barrel fold metal-dependent hydrolase